MQQFVSGMFGIALILCTFSQPLHAMQTHVDLSYAHSGERDLLLDLYLPDLPDTDNAAAPPLVIWLHGGAWRSGDKGNAPTGFVDRGYAVASVDFRNSPEAKFPAQIHDIKAAVRFLRASAPQYGYNPDKIVLWGYSSGAHLAALAGTSVFHPELEGTLGNHRDVSSAVQAIIGIAAPTNLLTILQQSTPHGVNVRTAALQDLFGKPLEDPTMGEWLHLASPVMHVSAICPPLLLFHGVQDIQVPINQALELQLAYQQFDLHVETVWLPDADHVSGEYFTPQYTQLLLDFLQRVL